MTIKCSVFGHRFGDAEITREREERGSEVVTTITETETCERCGETRVVSENTEVTTLETPAEIVEGTTDGADVDADADTDTGAELNASAGADADADESGSGDAPAVEHHETGQPAAEADGLIDEAETSSTPAATSERDRTTPSDGHVGGPDPTGEDDAVILEEAPDTEKDDDSQQRAPGEWPEEGEESAAEEEWMPDMTNVSGTGTDGLPSVESEQPDIERTGEAMTVPEGEFHCPECGFTTAVDSSSLREGDFCPECHRGALEHHPEAGN